MVVQRFFGCTANSVWFIHLLCILHKEIVVLSLGIIDVLDLFMRPVLVLPQPGLR